jgi:hypothetical protein
VALSSAGKAGELPATRAAKENGQWTATGFTGTVTWNVPELPDGCGASLYRMQVTGTSYQMQVTGTSYRMQVTGTSS